GGGGGGGGNSTLSSSSSTSSVNSSSSSSSIADISGLVFGDSLNADWGHFSAFQWSVVESKGSSYDDGQVTTNVAQWKVVQSASTDHQSVIEASFLTSDKSWAQFEVSTSSTKDLSDYETGKLSFDLNVLDWGNALNQNTGTGAFEVRVECGWPCSSHTNLFTVKDVNVWSHVEVSIAEMVKDGLDLTKVDRTFIIKPAAKDINGVRIQLDNIKWTKGTIKANKPKIIYAEHFNENSSGGWQFFLADERSSYGSYALNYGLVVYPSASIFYNDWALEKQLANAINLDRKKVSLQFYPNKQIMGQGWLQFSATDGVGRKAYSNYIQVNQLQADAWNRVSFTVNNTEFAADAGFSADDVRTLG
ncbi:MAG: hypothetical protein EOO68_37900, partial [Moraxellaceae bacterium]